MSDVVSRTLGPRTWEEFVALEEDDRRELIDGELMELEVPSDIHEYIVVMLAHLLLGWAGPRKAGFVLGSGFKVRIDERRGVMPDLQFYRTGNRSAMRSQQGLLRGHPDLVVEIVSSTSPRYDRVTKLGYYASIGVPEYWIVEPASRTLERLVLHGDKYLIAQVGAGDDVVRPASFDGLEIALGPLWTIPDAD